MTSKKSWNEAANLCPQTCPQNASVFFLCNSHTCCKGVIECENRSFSVLREKQGVNIIILPLSQCSTIGETFAMFNLRPFPLLA